MAALQDVQLAGGVHLRAGIVVAHGDLGERTERVEPRHGVGARLDARDLGRHAVAHLAEIPVFQLVDPVPRGQERVLQLLELLGEVALVGHQGLLADVVRRDVLEPRRARHVDVVAEDLVVADLELFDPGTLPLARLQLGHHLRAVVADAAEPVDLLGVALAQDAALADGEGRFFADGAVDLRAQILQRVHAADLAQLRAPETVGQLLEPGQHRGAVCERVQVAAAGGAVDRAAHEPLHIADLPEREHQLAARHMVLRKLADGGEAALDRHDRQKRPLHPGAQQAPAHGSPGLVQHPQEGAALFPAAEGLRQLQRAARRPVELHIAPAVEHVEAADVAHVELLRLLNVLQQRPRRADGLRRFPEPALVDVPEAEALADAGRGGQVLKHRAAELQHGAELLPEEAGDRLLLQRAGREHGLARGEAPELVDDVGDGGAVIGGGAEFARGDIAEGGAAPAVGKMNGAEVV